MCMGGNCFDGACSRCWSAMKVIGGGLILLNAFVWPKWGVTDSSTMSSLTGWLAFLAVLLVIKGVIKFIMPTCPHCKGEVAVKAAPKKGK